MSAGHVRRRGKGSWEIKFDLGRDPATGKRRIRYHAFKGTKRQAEIEAAKLIAAANAGNDIEPSKITVGEFFDRWEAWAAANVTPKTLERYRELLAHVRRRLGATPLQKLRPASLAALYGQLLEDGKASRRKEGEPTGLSARTVGHVHRVLHRALGHATQWGMVPSNVAAVVDPPRVIAAEVAIVKADAVGKLLQGLRDDPVYPIAVLALGTGMRRGELLALRWGDVRLNEATIQVERSLESTKAGLRFKAPKTKHGRRTVTLPVTVVTEIRAHWKRQQELRLSLGLGKAPDDALVFCDIEGQPLDPDAVSKAWRRAAEAAGAPPALTLHGLRHTHASALISAGVDVLTVSRRLGHGSPAITLTVYGHLFVNRDDRSAAAIESALSP